MLEHGSWQEFKACFSSSSSTFRIVHNSPQVPTSNFLRRLFIFWQYFSTDNKVLVWKRSTFKKIIFPFLQRKWTVLHFHTHACSLSLIHIHTHKHKHTHTQTTFSLLNSYLMLQHGKQQTVWAEYQTEASTIFPYTWGLITRLLCMSTLHFSNCGHHTYWQVHIISLCIL